MSTSWPPSPLQFDPWQAVAEGVEMTRKVVAGAGTLSRLQPGDVAVAPTPKDAVLRVDNATLYHYRPVVERPFPIPVLISYAFFNRYYMIDLHRERSLVRSLLELGLDLYVIDWGYPRRVDRWAHHRRLRELPGRGHIGIYVSGKVQRELPDVLSRWILERD